MRRLGIYYYNFAYLVLRNMYVSNSQPHTQLTPCSRVIVRSARGSLALSAAVVSAGITRESLWEEHSCHKRAGLHLTSSELPTDLLCSPAWLVDTRKSSLSRKTPRSRQRSRNPKATTRRPRRKRRWCSHVASAGHKCQIPRPSSSILRASTPRTLFPQS